MAPPFMMGAPPILVTVVDFIPACVRGLGLVLQLGRKRDSILFTSLGIRFLVTIIRVALATFLLVAASLLGQLLNSLLILLDFGLKGQDGSSTGV